ncbi:MAG: 6,7-dimethyl-8-ribityllumazine synthase [Bacillota bacterium]|nr:6,7-dimethyl-8-ribityllumazine synthase [Bacillota bacterium]
MATFEGSLTGDGLRLAAVVSRFNDLVTARLLAGAEAELRRHGLPEEALDVAWVPGAFELPLVARRLAGSGRYDAVIALGAVLRGQTPHFDFVAGGAAQGLLQASLSTGVPVLFGVITAETVEEALDRAGLRAGNRGAEAARAALEMANLMRTLPPDPRGAAAAGG